MKLPIDEKTRKSIRENFKENLFVTAGAGTGKTQSIVDRVIAAICNENIPPEKIAVTTFTEKAANELIFKIRRGLEKKAPEKAGLIKKMFIGTLHSFALTLLKERPLESGIDPEVEIIEEDMADESIGEISKKIISDYFSIFENQKLYMDWEFDFFSGVYFFKTLYNFRELKPVKPEDPEINLNRFWQQHNNSFKEIPAILEKNKKDNPDGYEWIDREYSNWKALKNKPVEDIISYFVNLGILNKTGKLSSWSNYPGTRKSMLHNLLEPFKNAKNEIASYIAYEIYKIYNQLYQEFLKEYDIWKSERGLLDFSDILLKTRKLVKEIREVREYFQQRFELVIIDEFQDTDPVMCEILMFICQDGYEDVTWDNVKLMPGKLTVVGDEKQSIYRFRRADISIYNMTKKLFLKNGKIETLIQNFRSVKGLVNNNNYAFGEIFKKTQGVEQIIYNNIDSFRGKGSSSLKNNLIFLDLKIDLPSDTELECKRNGELRAEYLRKREAVAVCSWIKQAVQEKQLILNNKAAEYGDFLLLFKRRKCMNLYARILAKENIPAAMDGEGFILELPEVIDLFRLIRGSIQADDSVAVVAALRSAYMGISDEELYNHKINKGDFNYFIIDEKKGNKDVNHALSLLKSYNLILNKESPKYGFKRIFQEEKIKTILKQCRKLMGLNIYDSLCSFIDQSDVADSPSDLINRIWDSILNGSNLDPSFYPFKKKKEVQMLTIHKAKGLESPVVILCDTGTKENAGVSHIFDRQNESLYFKFGVKPRTWNRNAEHMPGDAFSITSKGFGNKTDGEKQAISAENLRLEYVAATRAGDYFIIPTYRDKTAPFYSNLGNFYKEKKEYIYKEIKLDENKSMDTVLPVPDIRPLDKNADDKAYLVAKRLFSAREDVIKAIKTSSIPQSEYQTFSHEKVMARESKGYGPQYGLLFHRIMEIIVKNLGSNGKIAPSVIEGLINKRFEHILGTAAYEQNFIIDKDIRERIKMHIKKVLNSDLFKECLNANIRFAEYPLDLLINKDGIEIFKSGIIDLVFKKNNVWKIVDYKTDKIESKENIKKLEQFYKDQLNGYADAFSEIIGESVEKELLFIDYL